MCGSICNDSVNFSSETIGQSHLLASQVDTRWEGGPVVIVCSIFTFGWFEANGLLYNVKVGTIHDVPVHPGLTCENMSARARHDALWLYSKRMKSATLLQSIDNHLKSLPFTKTG